jgi:hypothetical protein
LMTRAMLQIVVPLTDDSRVVIYHCNVFIVQATCVNDQNIVFHRH